MDNKNLIVLGAVILGALLIVGFFAFNGEKNNEINEKIAKNAEKRYSITGDKPKIIEQNNKRYIESGKVADISASITGVKKDVTQAILDKSTAVVDWKLKVKFKDIPYDELYLYLMYTTASYYNKTKKALFSIYLYVPFNMNYDQYKMLLKKYLNQLKSELKKQCVGYNLTGCDGFIKMYDKMFNLFGSRQYFEKIKKLNGPVEFIYYYDNGTEKIYMSKYLFASIYGQLGALEPFVKKLLNDLPKLKKLNYSNNDNLSEIISNYYEIWINDSINNAIKILSKINKDYVVISKPVEHTDFADKIFGNLFVVNNTNISEEIDNLMNYSEKTFENSSLMKYIDSIDLKVYVDNKFDPNKFLPKNVENIKNIDIESLRSIFSKIKIDLINTIKKDPEVFNISKDNVDATIAQINTIYDQIEKQILYPLEEKSVIDNLYTLKMYIEAMLGSYYSSYNTYSTANISISGETNKEIPLESQLY